MTTIRRVAPSFDRWAEILSVIREAFAGMDGRIDPPSSAHRLNVAQMAADAAAGVAFVAESGDEIQGCVLCAPKHDVLYLGKLAVKPTLQSRGIGRALIEAAAAEASRRGLAALELQTRVELVENHAAFARLGFVKTGASAHPGYARPTSVTMRRELAWRHGANDNPAAHAEQRGEDETL